jgi:hypothetical protein
MSDDLFPIPETPLPPLEAARQRLAKAIEHEREAEQIFENQGPEALPGLEYAREQRRLSALVVGALEREAMKGTKS